MNADDKCSCHNMNNYPQQVETPLSQREKNFSGLFIAILKCVWNVEHFETKDEYPSLKISEIIESERDSYLNF